LKLSKAIFIASLIEYSNSSCKYQHKEHITFGILLGQHVTILFLSKYHVGALKVNQEKNVVNNLVFI
jgi:hypothetical protein